MSIYSDALTALQRVLAHGGDLTGPEKRNMIAVVRGAGSAGTAAATSDAAVQANLIQATTTAVDVTALKSAVDAQFDILDAIADGGPCAAAIATASTALRALATTTNTDSITSQLSGVTAAAASTAALAAAPDATLIANPIMDGDG